MAKTIPRVARVPHTAKRPECCPYCGSKHVTRKGTRRKKLEIVQIWRCSSCKRLFTPGPAALRNKTYPLRMILGALTDYDIGFTLEQTAARLKKKTNRTVSPSTIASWLDQYKRHCSYRCSRDSDLAAREGHYRNRISVGDYACSKIIRARACHHRPYRLSSD